MTLVELFVTSEDALFLSNSTSMARVSHVFSQSNLIMPNPDISSMKEASTFTYLFVLALTIALLMGNTGTDLIKNLYLYSLILFDPLN